MPHLTQLELKLNKHFYHIFIMHSYGRKLYFLQNISSLFLIIFENNIFIIEHKRKKNVKKCQNIYYKA